MERTVQRDELEAMRSIFEGYFDYTEVDKHLGGWFYAYLEVTDLKVVWSLLRTKNADYQSMIVQYLPPLILTFHFPPEYPEKKPPTFEITSQWLTRQQQSKLCGKLTEIWKENNGSEVLFLWANFLKEDSLSFLNITDVMDLTELYCDYIEGQENCEDAMQNISELPNEVVSPLEKDLIQKNVHNNDKALSKLPKIKKINIVEEMKKFNKMMKNITFLKSSFTCEICFLEKPGTHGMQFDPCYHAFCRDCLKTYFEGCIQEGKVQNLQCPQNCSAVVKNHQIKLLVSEEMFQRYDALQLKSTLDTMKDVVYCPRPICQYPVIYNLQENLAQCPRCEFAFCIHCRKTYHGVEMCYANLKQKEEVVKEYVAAKPERKLELEKTYGKVPLKKLVEEVGSEDWKKANTKQCPKCRASIDRYTGCNRVICSNCRTIFCWLCRQFLNPEDNYNHFFTPYSACNNRLFVDTDVIEDGMEALEWEDVGDGEIEEVEGGEIYRDDEEEQAEVAYYAMAGFFFN